MAAARRREQPSPARHPFATDVDKCYTTGFGGVPGAAARARMWLLGILPMLAAGVWRRRVATLVAGNPARLAARDQGRGVRTR